MKLNELELIFENTKFEELEIGIPYQFRHGNTMHINNMMVDKYHLTEENGKIYIHSPWRNEPVLIEKTSEIPLILKFTTESDNRIVCTLKKV